MQYLKKLTLAQVDALFIARFLGLASIAILFPLYIHVQWFTGPIINAILVISLFLVGIRGTVIICLVPSMMALASGLLPAILAPIVPFIMISNVIFIFVVDWLYRNFKDAQIGYWLGVVFGAGFKFLFLFASISYINNLLIKKELTIKVAQMMSWPQFATAVAGGMLAFLALKWLKRI